MVLHTLYPFMTAPLFDFSLEEGLGNLQNIEKGFFAVPVED